MGEKRKEVRKRDGEKSSEIGHEGKKKRTERDGGER